MEPTQASCVFPEDNNQHAPHGPTGRAEELLHMWRRLGFQWATSHHVPWSSDVGDHVATVKGVVR